jgi:hypothetical protein
MRKIFYSFMILLVFLITSGVFAQSTPPTLLTPPNHSTNVSLYPTFSWTAVPNATSYQLQVFQGPTTVLDINLATTSYTVITAILSPSTYYYWHVIAMGPTPQTSNSFDFTTTVLVPVAPVLLTPANNSTNVSLTLTLDWNTSIGAATYCLQVSTDPNFGSTVINICGLVNSGYAVPTGFLLNSTLYYWRVNATNPGGTSGWSEAWNFTTAPAPPPMTTLVLPANNATGVTQPVTFKWRKLPTATSYHIQVSLNATFTAVVVDDDAADTVYTIPQGGLSGTTIYYWHVLGSNAGGPGPYADPPFHFTTAVAPPAPPVLTNPPNHQVAVPITGQVFSWNSSAGATSYRIQISLSPTFSSTVVNQVTGASTTYTHNTPALLNNTTYYWRVNATNAGGTGNWSTVWDFTTIEATLPAPVLLSPPNSSINVPLTPIMNWTLVSGATAYRLQISTSPSFNTYVLNTTVQAPPYTVPSGILTGYTNYYWRVASINGGGTGANSASWTFRTVQTFTLNLKVFLEGFYNGATQTQVPDTVQILLAQGTAPFTFKDTSLALVGSDGMALSVSFAKAISGNYYIVIRHRNHLETWSNVAMYFSTGNPVNYNFTSSSTQAYCGNMKPVGSVWVLWGGDANQDGFVSPLDYDVYRPMFGYSGYMNCDFNGDGFVDGYDLLILNANFGKSKCGPY